MDFSNFSNQDLKKRKEELLLQMVQMISEPEVIKEFQLIEEELARRGE